MNICLFFDVSLNEKIVPMRCWVASNKQLLTKQTHLRQSFVGFLNNLVTSNIYYPCINPQSVVANFFN